MAAAGLSAFAIVLSGTRAAMVAGAAGSFFLWLWRGKRIGWRAIASGVAALAALSIFIASPAGQKVRSRYHWFVDDPRGGARPLLFRDSVRLAARRKEGAWTS